jgi:D-3-phosphoglycerate dehydrogenase / 2-oxoglutarate reductase
MVLNRILITPRSLTKDGHPSLGPLQDAGYEVVFATPGVQPDEPELRRLLPGCVGMLAGVEPITARVLEVATALRAISRNGVGVSNIDLDAARRLGIQVLVTPGANARGVAELTIGLILALARSIPFGDAALKGRRWSRRKGFELQGKTLGLVGCGQIGRCVARLALAFEMHVVAFDPCPDERFSPGERFAYGGLQDVLAAADIISLHCPPGADRLPLIDVSAIARMKHGVYLVNTARPELLDEDAVLQSLDSGAIAGLAVDVHGCEPPTDWRLAAHPHVVATAHIGGFTEQSVDRAVAAAVENLLAALDDRRRM